MQGLLDRLVHVLGEQLLRDYHSWVSSLKLLHEVEGARCTVPQRLEHFMLGWCRFRALGIHVQMVHRGNKSINSCLCQINGGCLRLLVSAMCTIKA